MYCALGTICPSALNNYEFESELHYLQNGCHCGSGEKTISGALAEVESKLAAVNELQEKVTTLRLSYETSVKELQAKNAELSFTKEEVTAKEVSGIFRHQNLNSLKLDQNLTSDSFSFLISI